MVIELCVVHFWSEIMLVISNQTRAARSFDFEITRMISDQIALHSVQLPLFITRILIGLCAVRCAFSLASSKYDCPERLLRKSISIKKKILNFPSFYELLLRNIL